MSVLRLNLGSSDDHKAGFVNVDMGPPADLIADLNERWPWAESTVDAIYAHDVFEHLTGPTWKTNGKVWCMNEAYRVLKPGGTLDLAVPCTYLADGRVNPGADADPTHRTRWTLDDRFYYNVEWNNSADERGRLGPNPSYGITALFRGEWKLYEYGRGSERRSKVLAMLEAVK